MQRFKLQVGADKTGEERDCEWVTKGRELHDVEEYKQIFKSSLKFITYLIKHSAKRLKLDWPEILKVKNEGLWPVGYSRVDATRSLWGANSVANSLSIILNRSHWTINAFPGYSYQTCWLFHLLTYFHRFIDLFFIFIVQFLNLL